MVVRISDLVQDFKDTEADATPWTIREIIDFIEETPGAILGCSNCEHCTRLRDKRWLCEELRIFVKDEDFCSRWVKGNRL